MKKFIISGYWKDDKSEFNGFVVLETNDVGKDDDNIFYYGLSENDIIEAIENVENTDLEFVITEYTEIKLN